MKRLCKICSLLLVACLLCGALLSCQNGAPEETKPTSDVVEPMQVEHIDIAGSLTLDMSSETLKQEVTVKSYVDGDTTHFHVPSSVVEGGVLKARYLAVNTPESTGKIEEWGKAASKYTRAALEKAVSIIVESDTDGWNLDSTGDRYLVWVWYKTEQNGEYRNLNLELLQEGLAIASNSANNRYGDLCMKAINQAKAEKLHVYSGKQDPDFFYGEAVELTLKELRCNVESYAGSKVAFNGIITKNSNNSIYIESYDSESDIYYGISVYYGFGLNGDALDILKVGNESRIVGTVQYYEAGGSYQVSGLTYQPMRPNDPANIQKISSGNTGAFREVTPAQLLQSQVTVAVGEEEKTFDFAYLSLCSSVSMKDLAVKSIYTTTDEESSSKGAMTLTCEGDGVTVAVRTAVLYDENGEKLTAADFEGKTIDVKGIVDIFDGQYQIKVLAAGDITVH